MYRNAHWYVLIISVLTVSGFVPTYFLNFDSALPRHHIHILFACAWLLLLFLQPLLASRGRLTWHRRLGWSSLIIFPILAATSFYIVWYASATDIVKGGVYPKLYWYDYWTVPAMAALWIVGIAKRKDTAIHQRCMLLTLIALAPPGYGRALFFYVLYPMGLSFNDTWHPMMLIMIAALTFMLYRERAAYWPTRAALGLVVFIYLTSFHIADAQWWADFVVWFGNPAENYEPMRR